MFGIAGGIFWGAFFKLAPMIANTIPSGDWHSFLSILVYVVIGYLGGIGIPLVLIFLGIGLIAEDE